MWLRFPIRPLDSTVVKKMNADEQYMQDFFNVFEGVERWGPGSERDTLYALDLLPQKPSKLLEIGCGKGAATVVLAKAINADITAIDNEPAALDRLAAKLVNNGLAHRVTLLNKSMTTIDLPDESFDTIWCETSIYVMGVENALKAWKRLLRPAGYLVFNDLVWLTDNRSQEARDFWVNEYPDMQNIQTRQAQIKQAGYEVLSTFTLSESGWANYYQPLEERLAEVRAEQGDRPAFQDIAAEIAIYKKYLSEFGYQFFIAQKVK